MFNGKIEALQEEKRTKNEVPKGNRREGACWQAVTV